MTQVCMELEVRAHSPVWLLSHHSSASLLLYRGGRGVGWAGGAERKGQSGLPGYSQLKGPLLQDPERLQLLLCRGVHHRDPRRQKRLR